MSLSMLYLRLTLISAFAVIALVCITYAHSGNNNNESSAVATLKGRPGLASGCIAPGSRAVTGTSDLKTLEKSCNF